MYWGEENQDTLWEPSSSKRCLGQRSEIKGQRSDTTEHQWMKICCSKFEQMSEIHQGSRISLWLGSLSLGHSSDGCWHSGKITYVSQKYSSRVFGMFTEKTRPGTDNQMPRWRPLGHVCLKSAENLEMKRQQRLQIPEDAEWTESFLQSHIVVVWESVFVRELNFTDHRKHKTT